MDISGIFSSIFGILKAMSKNVENKLTDKQVAEAKLRRLEAMRLQEIEGNPFDDEDIAMFEMFEREKWPHEKRRAYIIAQALDEPVPDAAE